MPSDLPGFGEIDALEKLLVGERGRRDRREMAECLLISFRSIPGVVSAPRDYLKKQFRLSKRTFEQFDIAKSILSNCKYVELNRMRFCDLIENVDEKIAVTISDRAKCYLVFVHLDELYQVKLLEFGPPGSNLSVKLYPREVAKRAVQVNSSMVSILALGPKNAPIIDVLTLDCLAKALDFFNIKLLPHLRFNLS